MSSNLQVCRTAKSSSHGWPISGLRWVTGKERLSGVHLFSASARGLGCSSGAETDATDSCSESSFSTVDGGGQRPKHQWRENGYIRKLQRSRTQRIVNRNTAQGPEGHNSCERLTRGSQKSQVPLKLQIKVNVQSGGLGICIAGGKGSLPYKDNEEGIFISKVSKEGPAEKAGLRVGDRVLEIDGQDMQEVSHHEAVSALRNAGSWVQVKVIRERSVPVEMQAHRRPDSMATHICQDWDVTICGDRANAIQSSNPTLCSRLLDNRIELHCNGNQSNNLEEFKPMKDTETMKNNALQVENTMTIPRIILTHPSTSDEDVEPLTQGSDDGDYYDYSAFDSHVYSDFLNSAFYPV